MENQNIFRDKRGEIRKLEFNETQFNIIKTNKGALRSGDIHPNNQYDVILKGIVEITMKKDNKDITVRKGPNEMIVIPSGTPHLFNSITESIMIEWWDGPFKAEYFQPYRKIVDEQFK